MGDQQSLETRPANDQPHTADRRRHYGVDEYDPNHRGRFHGTEQGEARMEANRFRQGEGYFAGVIPAATEGCLYRFRLNGEAQLYPDPASRFQPDGPHGPSQVVSWPIMLSGPAVRSINAFGTPRAPISTMSWTGSTATIRLCGRTSSLPSRWIIQSSTSRDGRRCSRRRAGAC